MRFVIPGKPFGKQRPRFSRASGSVYTPKETVSFERVVGQYAMAAGIPLIAEGGVRLIVTAVFEPAQSWSKKKRAAHLWGPHTQKPDLDNIVKAVKDGLERIAYANDSQVAETISRKMWGSSAETIIEVKPLKTFSLGAL